MNLIGWNVAGMGRGTAYRHARRNLNEWRRKVDEVTRSMAYASSDNLIESLLHCICDVLSKRSDRRPVH